MKARMFDAEHRQRNKGGKQFQNEALI